MTIRKRSSVEVRNIQELTEIFGLNPHHTFEIEFSFELNNKVIDTVKRRSLTVSGTSSTFFNFSNFL